MIKELTTTAKQVGDELIDISAELDQTMIRWSDEPSRPNGLSDTECVGFISDETAASDLNLVIDVQAPASNKAATLRTWAIESTMDEDQNERFTNIQLDFSVDYSHARELTQKGEGATRDDIRSVLHGKDAQLKRVIASNQSGRDKASQALLGERYDVTIAEPNEQDVNTDEIINALNNALLALKKSAYGAA